VIEAYAEDWARTFTVPIQVTVEPEPEARLPSDVEVALFRIAQEALMNAGKYAAAQEVRVALSFAADGIHLVVEDDGAEFDPDGLPAPSRWGGMGLYSMRERAALLGGSLTIETAPDEGTRLTLQTPMPTTR
jgi:two-component system sensor histidine kinase NreB